MKICEMLKQGKAYRIFLSKELAKQIPERLRKKYNEGDSLILCEIKEGRCPHQNQEEGIEVSYMDEDNIFSICKSKGLVNKLDVIPIM